jgi:hypothetical protein
VLAAREKREKEKKQRLDKETEKDLTQQTTATQYQHTKELEKSQKRAVTSLYKAAKDPSSPGPKKQGGKRKEKAPSRKSGITTNEDNNTDVPPKKAKRPVKRGVDKPPQGERTVRVASDTHGCGHSGLLDLIRMEKTYLQAFVREGGWLHQIPCKDCAKEEGSRNERVLDMASLLNLKGKKELGYYCNCGPTGHKMDEEDEPVHKQQWTCDMVLCMHCYHKRKLGMVEGGTRGKRNRRQKRMD